MEHRLIIRRKTYRVDGVNTVLIDPREELRRGKPVTLIAGEKIKAGQLVYIGSDGRAYRA